MSTMISLEVRALCRARQCLPTVPRCATVALAAHNLSFSRSFCAGAASSSGSKLVDSVNHALEKFPVTTALVYLYHNTAYVSAIYVLLLAAGIDGPRELGLSLVVNRLTQRLRMPVIFAAAAALVRAVPAFGRLQLSKLMMAPFADLRRFAGPEPVLWDPQPLPAAAAGGHNTTPQSTASSTSTWQALREQWRALRTSTSTSSSADAAGSSSGTDASSPPSPSSSGAARVAARGVLAAINALNMGGVLDKFGLAYVLCGRAIASTQLIAVAYAIRAGVDVDAALAAVTTAADAMVWQPVAGVLQEHAPAAYEWLAPHFDSSSSSSSGGVAGLGAAMPADGDPVASALAGAHEDGLAGSPAAQPVDGAVATPLDAHELPASGEIAAAAAETTPAALASAAADAASSVPAPASGLLSTAAGWMSRWALGCLILNAGYPLVLRYGVAGVAEWIGPRAAVLQGKLAAMEEEAKAAEAAEQQQELELQRGKDGVAKSASEPQPEGETSAATPSAAGR